MKHTVLWAAIAASLLGQPVLAQSSSSANQTANSSSNASNAGANSSTNTSTSSATQNASSGSTAANNNSQSNGLTATINIVNPVPSGSAETRSTNDSVLRQSINGETTQNQKVDATTRSESFSSGEHHQYIEYGGSYTIKNVPNVQAPPLISSNDTCMGSASGGLSVAGFGISGGATYTDEHCKRIKMSRELWNKGMKAASLALDCMDRDAREALELTGFVCPQTVRAQRAAAEATQVRLATPPAPVASLVTYPPALPAELLAPLPLVLAPAAVTTAATASPAATTDASAAAPVPPQAPRAEGRAAPVPAADASTLIRRVDDGALLQVRR